MPDAVVDTGVPKTANTTEPEALSCAARCAVALRDLAATGRIVLDQQWLILSEYANQLSAGGQPGPGDAFYRWVLTNRANPDRCILVGITPHAERGFVEFPAVPALASFDRADRKFVAVALAASVPIWIAVDTDWWQARPELETEHVELVFLCQEELSLAASVRAN
jgi:hypothetical protein